MPKIANLEISEVESNVYMVKNNSTGKYVKMGQKEVEYLGWVGSDNYHNEMEEYYKGDLSQGQRNYLFEKFCKWGFFSDRDSEIKGTIGGIERISRFFKADFTTIKLGNINPNAFLDRNLQLIRALFHPFALFLFICTMISAFVIVSNQPKTVSVLQNANITGVTIFLLYAMIILTIFIHELGHAAACKYFGGRVEKMGLMIFYLNPAMFCDISDVYLFKDKWKKFVVAFAGILTQWLLSSLAILLYFALLYLSVDQPLILYYAFINFGMSFLNLFPLVKLDGYWMLTYLLGISNLRNKSFAYMFSLIVFDKHYRRQYSKNEKIALFSYGLLTMLFTPFMWLGALFEINKWLLDFSPVFSWSLTASLAVGLCVSFGWFIHKQWKGNKEFRSSILNH